MRGPAAFVSRHLLRNLFDNLAFSIARTSSLVRSQLLTAPHKTKRMIFQVFVQMFALSRVNACSEPAIARSQRVSAAGRIFALFSTEPTYRANRVEIPVSTLP
jgi:hypothetical protein